MRKTLLTLVCLAAPLASLLLPGCGLVYKVEVRQGNVITPEMLGKLELGQTRRQVRFILGTPPITDPFHQERWDYYYSFGKLGQPPRDAQRLSLFFKDDQLVRATGDGVPERLRAESPDPNRAPTGP